MQKACLLSTHNLAYVKNIIIWVWSNWDINFIITLLLNLLTKVKSNFIINYTDWDFSNDYVWYENEST